jgi:hypothetical protein
MSRHRQVDFLWSCFGSYFLFLVLVPSQISRHFTFIFSFPQDGCWMFFLLLGSSLGVSVKARYTQECCQYTVTLTAYSKRNNNIAKIRVVACLPVIY